MALNPIAAEVTDLLSQLAAAKARLTALNNQRTVLGLTYQTDNPLIVAKDREVQDQVAVVNQLTALVAAKQKAMEELDSAAAEAVRNGLDPSSAYQKALADTQRATGAKYVYYAVAVVILILAIVYFIRKRKR